MTTQLKATVPTDADLEGNPGIGTSKGTTASGETPNDLNADLADNTIEGDSENGTNAQGGIDKADADRGPKDRP